MSGWCQTHLILSCVQPRGAGRCSEPPRDDRSSWETGRCCSAALGPPCKHCCEAGGSQLLLPAIPGPRSEAGGEWEPKGSVFHQGQSTGERVKRCWVCTPLFVCCWVSPAPTRKTGLAFSSIQEGGRIKQESNCSYETLKYLSASGRVFVQSEREMQIYGILMLLQERCFPGDRGAWQGNRTRRAVLLPLM